MPLIHGYSKDAFVKNLRALRKEDKAPRQAIAICYSIARKALKERGLRETAKRAKDWKDAIKLGLSSKKSASKKPVSKRRSSDSGKGRWVVLVRGKAVGGRVRFATKLFTTKQAAAAYANKHPGAKFGKRPAPSSLKDRSAGRRRKDYYLRAAWPTGSKEYDVFDPVAGKAVGRRSDSTGFYFPKRERDHEWEFATRTAAMAAKKRLAKAHIPNARLKVGKFSS